MATTDRSKDTSIELTEVRTVLSRAETALEQVQWSIRRNGMCIKGWEYIEVGPPNPIRPTTQGARRSWRPGTKYHGWVRGHRCDIDECDIYHHDPDAEEMAGKLDYVVRLLEPWRGKRSRRRR